MTLQETSNLEMGAQMTGHRVWLDDVERESIYGRAVLSRIADGSVAGLSLTPRAVMTALSGSRTYDRAIFNKIEDGISGEILAVELIIEDTCSAADLVRDIFDSSGGVNGWAALPPSPLNVAEPEDLKKSTIALYAQLKRPNIAVTIPGLPKYAKLIRELVVAGIPVNISLICSHDQFIDIAEAYMDAIEERIQKGLNPMITVFFSISVSHLYDALSMEMSREKAATMSIALATKIYSSMRQLQSSQRWQRADRAGARIFRLIWVTSADKPRARPEHALAKLLVAPDTVACLSVSSLDKFLAGQYTLVEILKKGNNGNTLLNGLEKKGVNIESVSVRLQKDLMERQIKTWIMMLEMLAQKSAALVRMKDES